jgi:hypothetical protein
VIRSVAMCLVVATVGCNGMESTPPRVADAGIDAHDVAGDIAGRPDASARSDAATADAGRTHDLGPRPDVPEVHGPTRLVETGLYADFARRTLADGIIEYTPRYELWSDGAEKRRYLLLPPGARIDTGDMDHWVFPVGTRIWKEFRVGARVIETRLVEKTAAGWWMIAYAWNDAEDDARAAPDGVDDARGSGHHVPSQEECVQCHANVRDVAIGVSALQLAGRAGPGTLTDLATRGFLSSSPTSEPRVPGDGVVQAALGYLHGNCGHCHNDQSFFHEASVLRLRLSIRDRDPAATPTYRTSINVPMFHVFDGVNLGVVPGAPERSQLWARMGRRDAAAMPPVCSLRTDPAGLVLVRDWINALP